MSAIHDLISQIDDPRLRERLTTEWASASQNKKFGLVFEDHLPELLPLYKARPRRGDLVCRRGGPNLRSLVPVDTVQNGAANTPWHALIEADIITDSDESFKAMPAEVIEALGPVNSGRYSGVAALSRLSGESHD